MPSASARPAQAIDPKAWCAKSLGASQQVIDDATEKSKRDQPKNETSLQTAPDWCVGDGRAHWALRVVGAEYGPSASEAWGLGIELAAVALVDGKETEVTRVENLGPLSVRIIGKLEALDFDADGTPELTWLISYEHPEGVNAEERVFLRVKDGRIVRYDFPEAGWADPDADGRLDAVSSERTYNHTACWNEMAFERVPLLHHQLADGTFSRDDAVAKAFARESCAERPKDLVVKSKAGLVDESKTAWHVECARLWGVTVTEIDRAIAKACSRTPTDDEYCASKPLKDTCYFQPLMHVIAEETPPLLAEP